MVELRVLSKESGLLNRTVPDHCSHHHSLLYGAVHPGGLFSGPVPLPRQKDFHAFLLTNAFPKLGIYTSIGILFYKYNLMGTLLGVVIIHMINSMMFMVWLPCSAFQAVHKQQEEAARDVGAGPIRTFFQVSFPMAMPGIMVATLYTFLGSMEEAQGTLLVGLARIKTMPVEMYGIILDYPGQAGAVFAILLMIPAAVMIFAMKKYIGPEAIAGGFKMK